MHACIYVCMYVCMYMHTYACDLLCMSEDNDSLFFPYRIGSGDQTEVVRCGGRCLFFSVFTST